MPPEGLDWLPKVEVLTDDEIVRLVRIGVEQLGIREVRFTGGEPLLRPGPGGHRRRRDRAAPRARRSASPPTRSGWPAWPRRWPQAGLDRINVSLDTVDRGRFKQLTHRDRLDDVARRAGRRAGAPG